MGLAQGIKWIMITRLPDFYNAFFCQTTFNLSLYFYTLHLDFEL